MLRQEKSACLETGRSVDVVTVVLCVRSPIPLAGLKAMLGGVTGLRVVAVTDDSRKMELLVRAEQPDMTILDAVAEDPDDLLQRVEKLRAEEASTSFTLIVPSQPDPELLAMAHAVGVRSFLSAHDPMVDILSAARRSSWLTRRAAAPVLTPRERDVLPFVANGWTDREISRKLNLAERSVKYHISNLLAKFNARNRAHLVHLSIRAGIGVLNCPNDTGQLAG